MSQPTPSPKEVEKLLLDAYEYRGSDLQLSKEKANRALSMSQILKDDTLIGRSLSKLGLFYMISAENDKAIAFSEKAISYFKKSNNEQEIATARYNVAGVYYRTNNYHLGMFHLIDCLTICRKYGDKHLESKSHKTLGTIYELLGDRTNAIRAYEQAVQCAEKIGDRDLESNAYNPLSGIYLKLSNLSHAMSLAQKSIAIKKETGDSRGYAYAIYARGKVFVKEKRFVEALCDFNEALALHQTVHDAFGTAMCYNKIARLYIAWNDPQVAKQYLEKALTFSEEHNLSLMRNKAYKILYKIYKNEGDHRGALRYLELYNQIKDAAENSQTLKVIENYERISLLQSKENEATMERERTAILVKQQRAEQESEVRQNFLSSMSHEIRTPLNAITSIISLLKDEYITGDQQLLNSLQFSAKNLMQIINDILDFTKLDSNKMVIEKHPTNLHELLANIRLTYLEMAREKGLDLNLTLDDAVAQHYKVDETKMFQIVGNLVSNAIKFTDKGQVDITLITKSGGTTMDTLQLSVTDTGRGVAPEEKERLFDSFYIPQTITTRNGNGTGLGLAIVKKLVEMHESRIQITSQVGVGSSFYFDVELEKSLPARQTPKQLSETLQNKVAIVAEDNEINALVMNKLLMKWGVAMKRAKNGQEAIHLANKEKVDFILMDIHMPVVNGFQATQTIRSTKNPNQNTTILALTADVTAGNTDEFSELFEGFLWKPIEIEKLFSALIRDYSELRPLGIAL